MAADRSVARSERLKKEVSLVDLLGDRCILSWLDIQVYGSERIKFPLE